MSVQFVDESGSEFPDGGFPDRGFSDRGFPDRGSHRHVPRWLLGLLAAATAVIALAVVVKHDPPTRPIAAPPSPFTTPAPKPTVPVVAVDNTFSTIYERAVDTSPAEDILRTGSDSTSCRRVQIGTVPQHTAGLALVRGLRGYQLIDAARIIDQGAGLCALQVRARDTSGTVAILLVSSPVPSSSTSRPNVIQSHAEPVHGAAVEYVRFTTSDGWTVVVGTAGPKGAQPSTRALAEVAVDSAVRW